MLESVAPVPRRADWHLDSGLFLFQVIILPTSDILSWDYMNDSFNAPTPQSENNLSITFFGHSTVLIEANDTRLITDPVFSRRIIHLHRTHPPVEFSTIRHVDGVLISHLHFDHLDIRSLKMFPRHTCIYVPTGAGILLKRYGFDNCQEVQLGETFPVNNVNVRAVKADHSKSRHPFGIEADALGYVIEAGASVYFPGDTRLFDGMAEIDDDLDVALMPVWGWGPHLGRMHMSPRQAAEALQLLKPRAAIPIHWGTYIPTGMAWMRPAFHHIPPLDFARHARDIAPQVEVTILKPGDTLAYTRSL